MEQILKERQQSKNNLCKTIITASNTITNIENNIHELREEITELYVRQEKTEDWENHTDTRIEEIKFDIECLDKENNKQNKIIEKLEKPKQTTCMECKWWHDFYNCTQHRCRTTQDSKPNTTTYNPTDKRNYQRLQQRIDTLEKQMHTTFELQESDNQRITKLEKTNHTQTQVLDIDMKTITNHENRLNKLERHDHNIELMNQHTSKPNL